MTAPINSGSDPMRHVQELQYRMNGVSGTMVGGGQAITQAQQLAPGQSVTSPDELSRVCGRDQLRLSEEAMEMRAGGPGRDQGVYSPPVQALMENMKHQISTGKDNPHKDRSFDFFSLLTGNREEKPGKTGEQTTGTAGVPCEAESQGKAEGSSFKDLVMGMISQAMSSEGSDEPGQAQAGSEPPPAETQVAPEFSLPEFLSAARQEVNTGPELPKQSGDSPFDADWARNRILTLSRD